LSVGEAGDLGALEGVADEGADGLFVDFFVVGAFVVGVVEVEGGLFEVFGQVDLLSAWVGAYLYSLMVTCPCGETRTMSVSARCSSFLLRGRLRMATVILGVSAGRIDLNDFC
jgi:hypothetical protein